jgi:ParB-like chromosome segregation protein Spo0J
MDSTTSEPVITQAVPVAGIQNIAEPLAKMVQICDLHDHPRQRELFGDLPAAEFAALVEDLGRYGQREPIRILESGRILAGHQRVRAGRRLGWTEIKAIVIEVQDEAEAEELLIADNLHRRHLGPLALARLYLAQLESERQNGDRDEGDLRDEIARRMGGISGRTLDRYRLILKTPPIVQQAVEAGEIPMSMATRIANLCEAEQQNLAEELAAGGPPRLIVSRHLDNGEANEITEARKRYRELHNFLKRHISAIKNQSKKVVGHGLNADEAISVLLGAVALFQRLAAEEKRKRDSFFKEIRARVSTAIEIE